MAIAPSLLAADVAPRVLAPRARMTDVVLAPRAAPRADALPAIVDPAPRGGAPMWLAFVNTDDMRRGDNGRRADVLLDFDVFVDWLQANEVLDAERAAGIRRRAYQQPAGAAASLVDARRVRAALRALAERGAASGKARGDALTEINRVLGRSAGTRRLEELPDGGYARTFVTVGDAFAALMVPIADSAAESLIAGELARVRRCADPRCARVFLDTTKNGRRRWCDMATCGNRAKAARHRARQHAPSHASSHAPPR